jgi:hypothetical protein
MAISMVIIRIHVQLLSTLKSSLQISGLISDASVRNSFVGE